MQKFIRLCAIVAAALVALSLLLLIVMIPPVCVRCADRFNYLVILLAPAAV